VRLDVIGSSPAWPNAGGACSGYLVEGRVLLDCGPGVLAKLRERDPWPAVEAIAITHLHLDHWGDLVPWVWGCLFGPGAGLPRPALRLPPGATETLRPILARLGSEDMLERAFDVDEYPEHEPFELAGHRLTALSVPHYDIPAYGFRIQGDRTLAYSGDAGPADALADLARDADLFVCEATLDEGAADGPPRGHLSVTEAQAAFLASGARRLLLTHRPQERSLPAGFELASDGLVVEL
jgi:ribonuclease BN (tRNA processing enzyme)